MPDNTITVNGNTYEIKPRANLRGAELAGAYLYGANLYRADLRGANLRGANLYRAELAGADLYGANLYRSDLRGANLYRADLRGANLYRASLCGANLCGADLCGADLCGADLCGADLCGADLCGAKNVSPLVLARLSILPDEGDVIGWKKCRDDVLVKLRIPADARRSNATGRKCRTERAEVVEIIGDTVAVSQWDDRFVYRVGETVTPTEPFDDDRFNECASGIHFFITRAEAEDY